jgi:hypothetical protein
VQFVGQQKFTLRDASHRSVGDEGEWQVHREKSDKGRRVIKRGGAGDPLKIAACAMSRWRLLSALVRLARAHTRSLSLSISPPPLPSLLPSLPPYLLLPSLSLALHTFTHNQDKASAWRFESPLPDLKWQLVDLPET